MCFLSCLGVLYVYGAGTFLGILYVYGCLDWFSIRGSCLSLSLIGNHIWAAILCGYFVGDCFRVCFTTRYCFGLVFVRLLFCISLVFSVCLIKIVMNTYQAASWSDPSSSSDEEEEISCDNYKMSK
jgi:hypothetical protein